MNEWHCFKCKEKMEEVSEIAIKYGDMDLPPASGLKCPKCGGEYLLEELVLGELAGAEQILQAK